jgi:hypothetical protein
MLHPLPSSTAQQLRVPCRAAARPGPEYVKLSEPAVPLEPCQSTRYGGGVGAQGYSNTSSAASVSQLVKSRLHGTCRGTYPMYNIMHHGILSIYLVDSLQGTGRCDLQ